MDPKWRDPYGFGKAVAKVARHALIAEELGNSTLNTAAIDAIELALTPWLEAKNDDTLVYDGTWGGLVSKDGVDSTEMDFGNGM